MFKGISKKKAGFRFFRNPAFLFYQLNGGFIMLKKDYATYLDLAEQFSKTLSGKTYITSRRKLKDNNGPYYSEEQQGDFYFLTLHSLVVKILPLGATSHYKRLAGNQMKPNVKQAVAKILGITDPDDELVMKYYLAIREYDEDIEKYDYSPYLQTVTALDSGMEVYHAYRNLKSGYIDWEGIMSLGRYYLNYNVINSVNFKVKNFILIDSDFLLESRNKNVTNFVIALINWSRRYTDWNFYLMTKDKRVFPFINGQQQATTNALDVINNYKK